MEGPHSAVFSASYYFFLLCPNILLSTLFSVTVNVCYSLNMRDHVSQPHKTAGKSLVGCRVLKILCVDRAFRNTRMIASFFTEFKMMTWCPLDIYNEQTTVTAHM
jgi:hypothetical protein